jgi:RecB family exonuclease
VRDKERERVRRDFHELLSYDWEHAGRRFVATERTFGRPVPLELPLAGRSLFVRGQIDRIDADESVTLIRDWKTGRTQPRAGGQAGPMPVLDVQLAVYALVAERLAAEWGVPSRVATAYAYINRGAEERSWRDDFRQTLAPAALEWLDVAADLLAARTFPRTPDAADCTYCRFRPVCADPHARARRVLEGDDAVLRRFAALKHGADEE